MASFFKHVGKVNSKKVIIVQRSLKNEEHMAVVIYSDIMPSKYHDDVMQILESEVGQNAYEFRDVLQRKMMSDGQNMLEALSSEGYLKRVSANSVIVTPNSKSSMRLDELNSLLNTVGRGEEAVKRLERLENSQGMADPAKQAATDAAVSESVSMSDLNGTTPTPVADVVAPTPSTNDVMMQMMQMMQSMQNQINELKQPVAEKTTIKTVKSKTKTGV